MLTESGEKIYPTLSDAIPKLEELNIQTQVDEREQMEGELSRYRWSNAGGRRGRDPAALAGTDVKAFFHGAE